LRSDSHGRRKNTIIEGLRNLLVQFWPIDKLLPYIRNARTHTEEQVAQIATSIIEFGWTNQILVGANGVIIAGHARILAARKLQMAEVPVIVLDHLTETQPRALVLADNRLALNAGWDEEMREHLRLAMAGETTTSSSPAAAVQPRGRLSGRRVCEQSLEKRHSGFLSR